MAQTHMEALQRANAARLIALCDIDGNAAGRAAQQYGGKAYTSFRKMLKAESFEALWVCLPPYAHAGEEMEAAAKGIHLYVEKPIALSLSLAREVETSIRKAGIISSVGYQIRYCPHVTEAKRLLRGRRINMVSARYLCDMRGRAVTWWHTMSRSGGQLVEQSTHAVDLMRYLAGDIRRVFATAALREASGIRGWDVPDYSVVAVDFVSGAIGTIHSSASFPTPQVNGVEIACSDFELECTFDSVRVTTAEETRERRSPVDPLPLAHKAFVDSVVSGKPRGIRSPYSDAVKTLAVTLAANESAARGRAVELAA